MAKRQKLDYSVRQAIVKLHKEKCTIREISEKVKRSKSVVGRVVKSYNDTGNDTGKNSLDATVYIKAKIFFIIILCNTSITDIEHLPNYTTLYHEPT